jgi:ribosome-associated protein
MLETNSELNTLQHILEDIQAADVTVIDVSKQTTITDFMVICSGRSSRHVKAIAEYVMEQMKHAGYPSIGNTGLENGEWALVDLSNIIVHVLQPSYRDFYNLEGLWQTNVKP